MYDNVNNAFRKLDMATSLSWMWQLTLLIVIFRGDKVPDLYWEKKNGELASGDDITVLVANLAKIRNFISG